MTTYVITSPSFCAGLVVESGVVTQAPPIIKWTVAKDWTKVRDYCRQMGWQVEAVPEKEHPTWVEWHGKSYEFHWNPQGLARVFVHEDGDRVETTFSKLPDEIREIIAS